MYFRKPDLKNDDRYTREEIDKIIPFKPEFVEGNIKTSTNLLNRPNPQQSSINDFPAVIDSYHNEYLLRPKSREKVVDEKQNIIKN